MREMNLPFASSRTERVVIMKGAQLRGKQGANLSVGLRSMAARFLFPMPERPAGEGRLRLRPLRQ
jgi:hypothetical protein